VEVCVPSSAPKRVEFLFVVDVQRREQRSREGRSAGHVIEYLDALPFRQLYVDCQVWKITPLATVA